MRAEEEPLGGTRAEQLGRLIEEEGGEGSTVWASFNWVRPVDLNTALEQQKRLTELVDASQLVVKTAAIEEAIDEWLAVASSGGCRVRTRRSSWPRRMGCR